MGRLNQYTVSPSYQRGAATLVVSLVLLVAISLISLFTARSVLMEQRVSVNDYKAKQLSASADAGLEFGIQWLNANGGSITWTTDTTVSGYNQRSTNTIQTTLATGYTGAVVLRRNSALPNRLLIVAGAASSSSVALAAATGTATTTAVAVSRTQTLMTTLIASNPGAGFLVNGCLSGVTGNPDVENMDNPTGAGIITSQSAACITPGHLNMHSSTVNGDAFTGTAWDRTFGITKTEFQALAAADAAADATPATYTDRTYIYVTSSANWHDDVGTLSPIHPTILVFAPEAGCPKLNGGPVIVGIVYYEGSCSDQGWGGAQVYGSVVTDADITKLTANAFIHYSDSYINPLGTAYTGVKSRIPGGWIDQ